MAEYAIFYKGERLTGPFDSSPPLEAEVYSTEETRIGTWLGKPLYRKVYALKTPSTTGQNTVGTFESYMDVVGIGGYLITSVGVHQPLNCTYGSNAAVVTKDTNIRMLVSHTDYVSRPCWVVLEYTKTTDSATAESSTLMAAEQVSFVEEV